MHMPPRLLTCGLLALVGSLGFAAGRATAPRATDEAVLGELARQRELLEEHIAQPPQVRCAVGTAATGSLDEAGLRTVLVQTLREELGTHGGHPAKPEPPEPPPPPLEAVAAHQEGLRRVDAALGARQWSEEDARVLRRLLGAMTDDQREEVISRLSVSINAGRLDVQVQGMPF